MSWGQGRFSGPPESALLQGWLSVWRAWSRPRTFLSVPAAQVLQGVSLLVEGFVFAEGASLSTNQFFDGCRT